VITVLLCAGYATRMHPLTRDFPKPLLPVAGKPVLDYFLAQLMGIEGEHAVHVVTNARFATHFKAWREDWMKRHGSSFTEITIHNDGSTGNDNRLGACRDMAWVFEKIPKFTHALVAAGDNIFRFPLAPLWEEFMDTGFHRIVLLPENDGEKLKRTGVPEFGKADRVIRLWEKPVCPPSNWSCPAIYFFKTAAVPLLNAFLHTSGNRDAPGHFIDYLCQHSTVYAFKVRSCRFDIGSIDDYHKADERLREEPVFMMNPG
jgi:glucose-1-phosphate thymidylyltransferase